MAESRPNLRIYDVHLDAFRDATQADIDILSAVANSRAELRTAFETIDDKLAARLREIRSKAGLPA